MAFFRLEAKIVSRSDGKSACSAAAYRAGQKIMSEYDGCTYDYRRKQNVEDAVVLLPDNAPAEYSDRATLWNSVDLKESQVNAQLCRDVLLILPTELPFEAHKKMVTEYAQEQWISDGMIADIAWHNPPRMNSRKQPVDINGNVTNDPSLYIYDNPHAHVLLTLRPLNDAGDWEAKKQKLYVCEKDGEQRLFSPADLKKTQGWEKIYHYSDNEGHKQWLTRSYVADHPDKEYTLISKYPKSVQDLNPKIAKWNSTETLIGWREAWAEKMNQTLAMYGIDEQVSHLSYKEQGLDLIPTLHEGKEVTIAEKRLKEEYDRKIAAGENAVLQHTEIRNLNLAIKDHNEEMKIIYNLQKLKQKMEDFLEPIHARIELISSSVAERLEHLRCEIISIGVKIKDALTLKDTISEKIKFGQEYIDALAPIRIERIKMMEIRLEEYKNLYDKTNPLHKNRRKSIMEKIETLENTISIQQDNLKYASTAADEIASLKADADALDHKIADFTKIRDDKTSEYATLTKSISIKDQTEINEDRLKIRDQIESEYINKEIKVKFENAATVFDKEYSRNQNMDVQKIKIEV